MPPSPPGRHYTAPGPATLVVALARRNNRQSIWDPTCGDGAILAAARELGHPETLLVGDDADGDAITIARQRLPGARLQQRDLFDDAGRRPIVDVIVGNPPFLRHEELGPDKERFHAMLEPRWGPLPGRADLALLCLLRALAFLRPGGRLAFVLPDTAFDGQAGDQVRRLILRRHRLVALVESEVEGWFRNAAVHTVIACFEARAGGTTSAFATLRRPAAAECAADIEAGRSGRGMTVRRRDPRGGRWTAILRSPPELDLALSLPGMSRLGDPKGPASLRYGLKVGISDFFAPRDPARLVDAGVEAAHLLPFLRTLDGMNERVVRPKDVAGRLFVAGEEAVDESRSPGAARWIADGAARTTPDGIPWPAVPSVRSNKPWWRLRPKAAGPVIVPQFRAERHFALWNPDGVLVNNSCWTADPGSALPAELLAAFLDLSLAALAAEVFGRANLGEGLLTLYGPDLEALPVPSVEALRARDPEPILDAWRALAAGRVLPFPEEANGGPRRRLDAAWERWSGAPAGLSAELRLGTVRLLDIRKARVADRKSTGHSTPGERFWEK
jgi:SAM-dependent methyltransferase